MWAIREELPLAKSPVVLSHPLVAQRRGQLVIMLRVELVGAGHPVELIASIVPIVQSIRLLSSRGVDLRGGAARRHATLT